MEKVILKKKDVLVVATAQHPGLLSGNTSYNLEFSTSEDLLQTLNAKQYDVIITDLKELPEILFETELLKNVSLFICGPIEHQDFLLNANENIVFWEGDFKNVSVDMALQILELNESNLKYRAECRAQKSKLDMQAIMMAELEQTNGNLISATWRERDIKKQLKDAMEEIENSKSIIELQNKRISDSINYARKIQLAINPTEDDLRKHVPESFILYKPKDIISGDFPWFKDKKGNVYVAAVDCTGHGVPGAMMSMIGNLLLNDIINNSETPLPGTVLDSLHQSVVHTLKQKTSKSNSTDGMDIALLQICFEKKELIFASAHRPLLIVRDNGITEYRGDKYPIGGVQYDKLRQPFVNKVIPYKEGDIVLMFSDGLPDQVGGEEKRKFMSTRIAEIALENSDSSIKELEAIYQMEIGQWMDGNKQVDDILLIAIKL